MTVDTLTDDVVEWERDRSPVRTARPDVREQLCAADLPALDRAGVLAFDGNRGIVDAAGSTMVHTRSSSSVDPADGSGGAALPVAQVLFTFLSVALFALTALSVGPFAAVPPTAAVGGALVLFAGLAVADRTD